MKESALANIQPCSGAGAGFGVLPISEAHHDHTSSCDLARRCHHCHFTDEETETQGAQPAVEPGLDSRWI